MKRIFLSFLIIVSSFLVVSFPIIAREPFGQQVKQAVRETVQQATSEGLSPAQIKQQVRQEIKQEIQNNNQGLLNQIKNFVKKNLRFGARIKGTIISIGDNELTINDKDGNSYQVLITDKTKIIRKFGGKSSFSEFSKDNQVFVIGKWTDDSKTTIEASLIRNESIQKRWGAFIGKITSLSSDSFVIETVNRGNQTVFFINAKLVNRKMETIKYDNIKLGHRVRVKGIWDRSLNTITEVDEVKDFSLPAQTGKN